MIKGLFTVCFASILLSCNPGANHSEAENNDIHTADTVLTLNNGARWKADSITNHNVIQLKVTANMFKVDPFPPLNTYQILGNDLSKDVNTMLQQCKMTGEDHEALHKWLTPIIQQSNRLKNVTDTIEAKKIFDSLDRRINLFPQYFD